MNIKFNEITKYICDFYFYVINIIEYDDFIDIIKIMIYPKIYFLENNNYKILRISDNEFNRNNISIDTIFKCIDFLRN